MQGPSLDRLADLIAKPALLCPGLAMFAAGLLLLFLGELPEGVRRYFIPSLIMYAIGSGLISYIHAFLFSRISVKAKSEERSILPDSTIITIFAAQVVWFAAFIGYNFWRHL
jgi:hypothetical protein